MPNNEISSDDLRKMITAPIMDESEIETEMAESRPTVRLPPTTNYNTVPSSIDDQTMLVRSVLGSVYSSVLDTQSRLEPRVDFKHPGIMVRLPGTRLQSKWIHWSEGPRPYNAARWSYPSAREFDQASTSSGSESSAPSTRSSKSNKRSAPFAPGDRVSKYPRRLSASECS